MSYLNRLLGTKFDVAQTIHILDGLELKLTSQTDDTVTYEIPTFRPDLEREVDLIEEVGRLFDYNKIESPNHGIYVSTEPLTDWEILVSQIREIGVQLACREIYTNSLISEKEALNFVSKEQIIETLNPLNKDMSMMRPTLAHGFLKAASYNFNRSAADIRFFEVGNVFELNEQFSYHEGIKEETHILFGLSGLKQIEHWSSKPVAYSIFDLKALVETFFSKLGILNAIQVELIGETTLQYSFKKIILGSISQISNSLKKVYDIDQDAFVAEFSINAIQKVQEKRPAFKFTPVPKFPVFEFDFAVVVSQEVDAGSLMKVIKSKAGNTLKNIDIFDVYEGKSIGEGSKSIAFRLNFLDPNKTLNVKDVEPIIQRVLKTLEKQFSAKLRS